MFQFKNHKKSTIEVARFRLRRMSPRSGERLRLGSKGFAPSEMEPRTSDGELVTDLLARAGAEFERQSSVGRAAAAGSSPGGSSNASIPSPGQACLFFQLLY